MKSATLDAPKRRSEYLSPTVGGLPVYRLTVDKYHQMIDHNILEEDDPVELLEGILVEKHAPSYETLPIFKLSVERYHRMIQFGILGEDDPVELLDGILVTKMPKNPPHRISVGLLCDMIGPLLPTGWFMESQEPVATANSEPEPDGSVVRGERRQYHSRHPRASDVGLLAQVSDSTLDYDRGPKKRSYAEAGYPIYWIVNLVDRQIEVYAQPSGPAENPDYAQQQIYRVGDAVPLVIDGTQLGTIPVVDLLP